MESTPNITQRLTNNEKRIKLSYLIPYIPNNTTNDNLNNDLILNDIKENRKIKDTSKFCNHKKCKFCL